VQSYKKNLLYCAELRKEPPVENAELGKEPPVESEEL
jgi:hypothetical protein